MKGKRLKSKREEIVRGNKINRERGGERKSKRLRE